MITSWDLSRPWGLDTSGVPSQQGLWLQEVEEVRAVSLLPHRPGHSACPPAR